MKNKRSNNLKKFALAITMTAALLSSSCGKEPVPADTTRPEITLKGLSKIYVVAGEKFTDPGCTASDDTDGDITDKIVIDGAVDTNTEGEYIINYIAEDAAGNAARERRTVIVVKDGPLSQSLTEFDLNIFYPETICKETSFDEAKYNEILFYGDSFIGNLGDYGVVDYSQLCSRGGISTDDFKTLPMTIQGDYDGYSGFDDAMSRLAPKTVVIMLNNDWTSRWTPEYLNESCSSVYAGFKNDYPNTNFVILSLMPVDIFYDSDAWVTDHGFSRNDRINKMNTYMCRLCEQYGFKFLNAAEAIKDPSTGAALTDYSDQADGVHLTYEGYRTMVEYIKNHMDW